MDQIPNIYFYSIIPFFIGFVFFIWGGIVEKEKEHWDTAFMIILVGITPFNSIVLGICGVFALCAVVIGLGSLGCSYIFNKLTEEDV